MSDEQDATAQTRAPQHPETTPHHPETTRKPPANGGTAPRVAPEGQAASLREADPAVGLTSADVRERTEAGLANDLPPRSGRTTWQIVRANVFTRINALLGALFVLVMTTGSWINGAFGLLIIANSIIGIVQELRAKHTLESLALIGEAKPTVRREGAERRIGREEVVLGDIIVIGPGEQIVVDGEVTEAAWLELDESLLTGESDPIAKRPGDAVMSGSFVASGTGSYRATKVGAASYAAGLAEEASRFTLVHSELTSGINRILRVITWILIPVGVLTVWGQIRAGEGDYTAIVLQVTGALVPMVPEGLVLITSTAFALGVVRLGRRRCLVNELPAIEGLARVDVVCADKTGTLTENAMAFGELVPLGGRGVDEGFAALSRLAGADEAPNASMRAIIEGLASVSKVSDTSDTYPRPYVSQVSDPSDTLRAVQPFTSAKKWSGASFAPDAEYPEGENLVLGAPDVLAPEGSKAAARAQRIGETGRRVLLVGRASRLVTDAKAPGNVEPLGLVVLEQKIRPDAARTLAYFRDQGVDVKVISGDNAASVGAVTRTLGMDSGEPVDARTIKQADFARTIGENSVFGRVTPQQKRAMVAALQEQGRTVAMTGDGVNDVLALKDADLGVAMGSGTEATRSVAKIVLLDDRFATLPHVVGEGRRVLGNIERVANLFLTKTIYSSLMAIAVLATALPYPFLPIHVTITGWFTIGIPAFLLSLPPNNERARSGFVQRVLGFGIPAGIVVAAVSFATFLLTRPAGAAPLMIRLDVTRLGPFGAYVQSLYVANPQASALAVQSSTAALLALIIASTWVLATIARPYEWWKVALIVLPLGGYGLIFTLPLTQRLFRLDSSNLAFMVVGTVLGLAGAALIELLWWTVQLYGRRFGTGCKTLWKPRAEREAERRQREFDKAELAELAEQWRGDAGR